MKKMTKDMKKEPAMDVKMPKKMGKACKMGKK